VPDKHAKEEQCGKEDALVSAAPTVTRAALQMLPSQSNLGEGKIEDRAKGKTHRAVHITAHCAAEADATAMMPVPEDIAGPSTADVTSTHYD
ncbi:hypothetical protein ABI013_15145, partial [Enterococcus faecium]|uniref:hypothetical protein n=1 Tax=Enterococcus faecium TaxID=1352 RepID=UPI003F424DD0